MASCPLISNSAFSDAIFVCKPEVLVNLNVSPGSRLTIFEKKVAGKTMAPDSTICNLASSSLTGIKISIEISVFDPVNVNPVSSRTNLIPFKIVIDVREEIARLTLFIAFIKAARLIVNSIRSPQCTKT